MEILRKIHNFAAMKPLKKHTIAFFGIQLAVWLIMMLAPASIVYLINPSGSSHWMFLDHAMMLVGPMCVIYMLSFYVLVPYLFFRGHKVWYILASLLLICLVNVQFFFADLSALAEPARLGFYTLITGLIIMHLIVAFAAFAICNYLRSHRIQLELQEERRKSVEAELTWLKNQLNPHFLFNSLNNISSLTQIDPDKAQEAIAQLSDLLRYALYESNKAQVPLAGEVEFVHNYISMMKLRCSDLTTVIEDLPDGSEMTSMQVPPLLFISFIENAFKHGTSSSQPTHINIRLAVDKEQIIFACRNSNCPKRDTDRSGSGVGLENTRRRLELLYPGRYSWQQSLENDEFSIVLKLINHNR